MVQVDEVIAGIDENEEDEASELGKSSLAKGIKTSTKSKNKKAGYNFDPIDVKVAKKKLLVRKLREMIINTGRRSDGRGVEDVRPISIETSLLPMAHGSSLFTRGETQVTPLALIHIHLPSNSSSSHSNPDIQNCTTDAYRKPHSYPTVNSRFLRLPLVPKPWSNDTRTSMN